MNRTRPFLPQQLRLNHHATPLQARHPSFKGEMHCRHGQTLERGHDRRRHSSTLEQGKGRGIIVQMTIPYMVRRSPSLLCGLSYAHSFLANTYQKLFAAARTPPASMEITSPGPILRARPPPPQRQPSLHNFWSICTPARSGMEDTIDEAPYAAACEDCEAPLPSNGDINMHGMDDDVALGADFLCRNCHRRVCDMCAVVETGVGRDCLQCRTSRRKWVGGIGWVP